MDFGPQSSGDANGFARRMRFHQSWWRAAVLGVPYGAGPTSKSTSTYGNMLTEEGGDAGLNFLTPQIREVADHRMREGGGVEPFRCRRNLLSSQPKCFNLFGPLCVKPWGALAQDLVAAIVDEPVAAILDARIEWDAGGLLADKTSFDAFVAYRRADGSASFLGIETKLTEPFSQSAEDPKRYAPYVPTGSNIWKAGVAVEQLGDKRWFQLWRNHLLVEALAGADVNPFGVGRVAVVYHPRDEGAVQAVGGYVELLSDPSQSIVDLRLDRLLASWAVPAQRHGVDDWLWNASSRYLGLALSEEAWRVHKASRSA